MLPLLTYAILLHSTIGVLGEPYSSAGYSGFVDGTNESPMMDNPGRDNQIVQPSNKPGSEVRSPEYPEIVDDEQNVISNPEWNPRGLPPGYVDSRESSYGYSGFVDGPNESPMMENPGWDSQIVQPNDISGSEVRSAGYSGFVNGRNQSPMMENTGSEVSSVWFTGREGNENSNSSIPEGFTVSEESTALFLISDKDNQEKIVENFSEWNLPDVIDDKPPPEDSPPQVTARVVLDKKSLHPDLVPNLKPLRYFENLDPKIPTELNGQHHYMKGVKYTTNRLLDFGRVASLGWNEPSISAFVEFKNFRGYISCIEIVNLKQHESGARVYFEKGGVGKNFVTIRFESFPFQHFDYFVKIFG